MKAILSCTCDDLYLFNLPFAIYSWHRVGVECIVFMTMPDSANARDALYTRWMLATGCAANQGLIVTPLVMAKSNKKPTYAQCARLYAAALPEISPSEVLITADADMCVFNTEYWQQFDHSGAINVIGADLVPPGQYPMCYISMPAVAWRHVMDIGVKSTYQEMLDDLLGGIECENFRGNQWAKDQETIYNHIQAIAIPPALHNRASPGTQFATRRADRDGWPDQINLNILDAHLPRPGYLPENFARIFDLFTEMYPSEDHSWMIAYRDAYLKLMEL